MILKAKGLTQCLGGGVEAISSQALKQALKCYWYNLKRFPLLWSKMCPEGVLKVSGLGPRPQPPSQSRTSWPGHRAKFSQPTTRDRPPASCKLPRGVPQEL